MIVGAGKASMKSVGQAVRKGMNWSDCPQAEFLLL